LFSSVALSLVQTNPNASNENQSRND